MPVRKEILQVAEWLRLFVESGQVTELRALDVARGNGSFVEAGFYDFDHLEDMARAALDLTRHARGVYFVPNPIISDTLARCANKVQRARKDELVADKLIVRRKWLLIDADAVRIEGISATDAEKQKASEVIKRAQALLSALGLERHVLADSGNGYHLLAAVDLPTSDSETARQILRCLASKLDTAEVKIDQKVFNPARIVKLYGTTARKGDDTPERPHRRTAVLETNL